MAWRGAFGLALYALPVLGECRALRVRRFVWDDVEELAGVYNAVGSASGAARAHTAATLAEQLRLPGCDPERHCFIAAADGAMAGYALVAYEPPIARAVAEGGVLPAMRGRGIGRALTQAVVEHAAGLGVSALHIEAGETNAALRRLLASEGLTPIKRFWQMRWQSDAPPDVRLPAGFATRSLITGEDEAALTELQNISFGANWGFSPNSVEQIAARVRQNRGGPECILFLTEGDPDSGKPAAYNWTMFSEDGAAPSGVISMTGVHPDYRGRGLGRAVVAAGIAYLVGRGAQSVSLEVDSGNTPARELYLALGFRKVSATVWHERRFG